jgi:glycosyltransferase involved in cell wall biosynthesis
MQRARGTFSSWPDGIVINSLRARAAHEALGYVPRKWHFIPNGFDTSYFRPRPECRDAIRASLAIPRDAHVIGMVARYHDFKDHSLFLRAARQLLNLDTPVYFILAGDGVSDDNAELCSQIDPALKARIRLIGPRADVPELAAAFDVATLTSYTEAFPNVVGEAMACGICCVVTDAGDAGMIVGPTGRCVPVRDASALAAAWTETLQMTDERRRDLGREARRRIEQNFSLDHVVAQYEGLYDSEATQLGRTLS